jgi:hypothetical protein
VRPLVILFLILLCACLPPKPVAFVDPATGQVFECRPANASSFPLLMPNVAEREQREVDECVREFEHVGWPRAKE